MNHLYLDIEAASGVKLSQTGPYRYSEDEHFRILLFGYAVDNEPIRIINLEHGERIPSEVIEALTDPGVKKIAYDAEYERICLSRYLKLPGNNYLCPEHWNCLRVWASYRGLPSTMKKIATLLNLDSAANPEVQLLLRDKYLHDPRVHGDQEPERQEKMLTSLHALGQCIRQNLMAERELHAYLQQYPMPDTEWVFYFMDQRINDRGVNLDRTLIRNAIICDRLFRDGVARRFVEITGISADSPARFRQWLSVNGIHVDSVSKETISRLRKRVPVELGEVLRLWELLSRTETRKYTALNDAVCSDGRLRGLFRFCGRPQGRFSYPLIQLDNLPACRCTCLPELREIVRTGTFTGMDSTCESVTDILTQLFITSFVPNRSCRLFVMEYHALEQRIQDWLVKDDWEALACMKNYVRDEQPRVSEYFHDDPRVTRLCLDIDNAIRRCLTHPAITKTHGLLFRGYNGTLCIELPSRQALCYREPEIMFGADGFSTIMYAGINKDGKWDILQGNGAVFLRDIIQGMARNLLLNAMRRITDAKYRIVLHLPGKVVVESDEPNALLNISAIMEQPPYWAKDIRLTTRGYACDRYLEKKQRPSHLIGK